VSRITTHVLDLVHGRPARGIAVRLEHHAAGRGWVKLSDRVTDEDGRVGDLTPVDGKIEAGRYRLTFETGAYFAARHEPAFHPEVIVVFEVADPSRHHHVPVLLSPFGYTTYRGS
jgi:5-hydroxyisourate hydrolase